MPICAHCRTEVADWFALKEHWSECEARDPLSAWMKAGRKDKARIAHEYMGAPAPRKMPEEVKKLLREKAKARRRRDRWERRRR